MRAHPDIDICGSWVKVFQSEKVFDLDDFLHHTYESHELIKSELLFLNIIKHPSVMFKRGCFVQNGIRYDEFYVNCEDYGLWAEIIDKLRFAIIPETLLYYRVHYSNTSIPNKKNIEILRRMNYAVYKIFLKRMQVTYTEDELALHMNLGFKEITSLNTRELNDYLNWLEKLARANQNSHYFESTSFLNLILANIRFLKQRMPGTPGNYSSIIKAIASIFTFESLLTIIWLKVKRKIAGLYARRLPAEVSGAQAW